MPLPFQHLPVDFIFLLLSKELMHLGDGSLVKCDWVHGSQGHWVMDTRLQVICDV